MELFPYQIPHCDALERSLMFHNVALDASDLGTGKTICACETARRLGKDLIVTGKKIMKPTWAYWMDQWGIDGVVGNWEMARVRGLPYRENALYVFDEVHEASGYKTLNAKLLINIYERGLPLLMLSATAIESPLKMWALGYILGFHNLKDFYKWGFQNGVKRNYGYPGFHFEGSGAILSRLHGHIFPEWGSRMRKALIPEFPECQTQLQMIEPAEVPSMPGLSRWWKEIAAREEAHEDKMEESGILGGNLVLPEMLFMRMRAELLKVPALIELAGDAVEQGHSVVIFCNFLTTLHALETIGFENAVTIQGEQRMLERLEAIAQFQGDKARVLISTIDSGGAGISLHDVTGLHPRMAFICPTWRAVTFRQALGRVHRAGGKSKAIQKLVYAAGTIEETVADRVRGKLNQIDLINDADLAEDEFAVPA